MATLDDTSDKCRSRRVELVLPMRTVLLVAATLGVLAAFVAIGDTFLIVFIGIFLALVFEAPVRYLMAKTGMSRGMAAAVTVLGTALVVTVLALLFLVPLVGERPRLSPGSSGDGRAAARVRRAVRAGRQRGGRERAGGIREGLGGGAGRDLRPCSASRATSSPAFLICLHDHLHLHVPAQRHREHETGVGERADAGRGRALAGRLGARDDLDLALGDRRRRDRHDRRNDAGAHGLAPRVELRPRAWR